MVPNALGCELRLENAPKPEAGLMAPRTPDPDPEPGFTSGLLAGGDNAVWPNIVDPEPKAGTDLTPEVLPKDKPLKGVVSFEAIGSSADVDGPTRKADSGGAGEEEPPKPNEDCPNFAGPAAEKEPKPVVGALDPKGGDDWPNDGDGD